MYCHPSTFKCSTIARWNYFDTEYSPVALYNFSDGYVAPNYCLDSSGNGNHLNTIAFGNATRVCYASNRCGQIGTVLFSTAAQSLTTASTVAAHLITGAITIQIIVDYNYLETIDSSVNIPLVQMSGTTTGTADNCQYGVGIVSPGGNFPIGYYFLWRTSTTSVYNYFSGGYKSGINVLAFTRADNKECKFYADGKLVSTPAITSSNLPTGGSTAKLYISACNPQSTTQLLRNAIISSVKINNSVLTDAQIKNEYRKVIGV